MACIWSFVWVQGPCFSVTISPIWWLKNKDKPGAVVETGRDILKVSCFRDSFIFSDSNSNCVDPPVSPTHGQGS